jgi:tetratricopeptide (TPR) repeat protein
MGIFSGKQPYDRGRILQAAAHAQQKKRRRKAIALYRQVLAVEPGNAELHTRLATLLAHKRERFDAWMSYRRAAQAQLQEGNVQDALTALREAVRLLPDEFDAWLQLGRVERKEGQARHAQQTLLRGAQQFRRDRPRAIHLLRRAREIEPWDFPTVSQLARLLARTRQRDEGRHGRRQRRGASHLAPLDRRHPAPPLAGLNRERRPVDSTGGCVRQSRAAAALCSASRWQWDGCGST